MVNEGLVDKRAIAQCLGAIINEPSILDDYSMEKEDFALPFYQLIFSAVYNLYYSGVNVIDCFCIDSYLSNYKEKYQEFNDNEGLNYISNVIELYQKENFQYYLTRLKKFSLLRYWESQGYDVRQIYDYTIAAPESQEREASKLDSMTIEDMIDAVSSKMVDETRIRFVTNTNHEGQLAGKGLRGLKESFKQTPDYGLPLQSPIISTITRGCRGKKLYLRSSNSGGGKAIPNSTILPTPTGYRRVGDIRVGDYLFDRQGRKTKVLAIYPQEQLKRVYEIHFSDGREARCCEDHLWAVWDMSSCCREYLVLSVKQMIELMKESGHNSHSAAESGCRFRVPINWPVHYEEKAYKISPYRVGRCLGNFQKRARDLNYDLEPYFVPNRIPDEYLLGSSAQRRSLLAGLIDATGEIMGIEGNTSFYAADDEMRSSYMELCHSLGMVVKVRKDDSSSGYFIEEVLSDLPGLGIVDIIPLNQYAKMTCFTVDNKDSLFLMNNFIVTHNTRTGIADMAGVSVPYVYNAQDKKWDYTGFSEPTLIISTELEISQVQTILVAFVSGVNESHILDGKYDPGEEKRVDQAIAYIESSPIYIEFIPDFGIADIEQLIRKYRREKAVYYFFFDYIHMSNKLIMEVAQMSSGMRLREDQILFLFIDALKNLCNKLDCFILSSTQLNGTYKDSTEKDETMLRGAKSMADRIDMGEISLAPSTSEAKMLEKITSHMINCPMVNLIRHVYKLRGNKWSKIKICQNVDLGTGRTKDLFVLDRNNQLIDIPIVNLKSVNKEQSMQVENIIKDNSMDIHQMPEDLDVKIVAANNNPTPVKEEENYGEEDLVATKFDW